MAIDSPLRYVKCDCVKAEGIDLSSIPIRVAGDSRALGELDGVVIDLAQRRACYLVVATPKGARRLVPLDVTQIHTSGVLVTSAQDVEASKPFEPSEFGRYDDDAMMSLLFGLESHAAA